MRSRIAIVGLCVLLIVGLAACGKKADETAAAPAAGQPAPGGQAAAPAQGTAPAAAPAPAPAPVVQTPPPPPPPPPIVIPAGTNVVIRMGNSLSSKTAQDGQAFTGVLANGIATGGKVVIPAGAGVTGVVSEAKSAGKFKGAAIIAIRLTEINVKGVPTNVGTDEYIVTQKGKGKRTAALIGGGAAGGALIGGLAGGGKGAGIGALIGAGAGTAGAAFTGNKELTIPAESAVSFKTTTPITVQQSAPSAAAAPVQ